MQKADYQTRILKLEKAFEETLEVLDDNSSFLNEDEEDTIIECKKVLYDEALDEEGDI